MELLEGLYQFFYKQPQHIRNEESEAPVLLANWMGRLSGIRSSNADISGSGSPSKSDYSLLAKEVGEWLLRFFGCAFCFCLDTER